jgi:hypothetical protein
MCSVVDCDKRFAGQKDVFSGGLSDCRQELNGKWHIAT